MVRDKTVARAALGGRDLGAGHLLHPQPPGDDRRRWWSTRSPRAGSAPGCRPAGRRAGTSRPGSEFQLGDVLIVTFEIVGRRRACCPACSACRRPMRWRGAISPASSSSCCCSCCRCWCRRSPSAFRWRRCSTRSALGGTISGVILANLVPTVPFVILVMIPFIEQIDPRIEAAARVFGAGTGRAVPPRAAAAAAARHSGRAAAGAGAHHRDVRADLPHRRPDQPDAGRRALLRGLRRRRARRCSRSTRWR